MRLITAGLMITSAMTLSNAEAAMVTHTFDNGSDLSAWEVDRCAPDSFGISDNELVMSVNAESSCLSQGGFYHTQGMKLDTGNATVLSIDMFVDSSWSGAERFGGMWGVSYDSTDTIDGYPIMEFQIPDASTAANGGFDVWDNSGWADLTASFLMDDWNTLMFKINGTQTEYYLNGALINSVDNGDTQYFGEVILNMKNAQNNYSVRYDNLSFGTADVNAPATAALFTLVLGGLVARRRNKV
ncbi:family 16 glycoside hydrolase [Alteromonas ponticola]|uniref:DUF1080 domain-containing protein n=1 Tax=Alteromonas ponticola TaxID=2720613 RepID=A0ABX1QYM8_9ALTE|nr:family 16 glycoside hydrolase [Alteromonas ponticola]NMH59325.1 DUF1080 domain-containing protein [Alteromonas ponticola]